MNIKNRKFTKVNALILFGLAFLSIVSVVMACNIPVFRYALERWYPDYYRCYVFYRGELDPAAKELATEIDKKYTVNGVPCNIACTFVDLGKKHPDSVMKIYDEHVKGTQLPVMVVSTPENYDSPEKVFWVKKFSKGSLMQIIDSPVRVDLYEKIMHGDSAVWVLFTCGDEEKDNAARLALDATISNLNATCEMPEGVIPADDNAVQGYNEDKLELSVPLKISFSSLEVSQKDTAEEFLVEIMKVSSPEMKDVIDEPFIAPVFGQGRVAAVIAKEDMISENMNYLGYYISGACSCQAKAQNIGFDLLMLGDWAKFDNQMVEDRKLPPIAGAGALIEETIIKTNMISAIDEADIDVAEDEPEKYPKVIFGVLFIIVVLLVGGTIVIKK